MNKIKVIDSGFSCKKQLVLLRRTSSISRCFFTRKPYCSNFNLISIFLIKRRGNFVSAHSNISLKIGQKGPLSLPAGKGRYFCLFLAFQNQIMGFNPNSFKINPIFTQIAVENALSTFVFKQNSIKIIAVISNRFHLSIFKMEDIFV
jgi:hypothetical protein